jgi:hypothetical protein
MTNNLYYYKAQKYRNKYHQLKLLYGGLVDDKIFTINYTSMTSKDYSIKQNSHTIKDNKESHYESSSQSYYVYSSIKDSLIKDQSITNIENYMKNNNTNISIEENNFDKDEFIKYLELAIKYNYKVNINFLDKTDSKMNKLFIKLGDKVNDPNMWLEELS